MKLRLFFAICTLFSISTQAAVSAFLKSDPVIFLIQGKDTDAKRIYDTLEVVPREVSATLLEKSLISPSGQVEVTCRYLATSQQDASCSVRVKRDNNFQVFDERKHAYLTINSTQDSVFLFSILVKNSQGKFPMYVSEKQDFAFSSESNRFILSYQQIPNP